MITEKDVLAALSRVPGPDGQTPLPQSGAIAGMTTVGGKVYLSIAIDPAKSMAMEAMRRTAETVLKGLPGVSGVSVTLTQMLLNDACSRECNADWPHIRDLR